MTDLRCLQREGAAVYTIPVPTAVIDLFNGTLQITECRQPVVWDVIIQKTSSSS
jgi:hypothetical protein